MARAPVEAAIEKHLRPTNITDALRAGGALCVVWYHNPTYWSLSDTASVDAAKLILLGWSMPFFYASSARFALVPPDKRTGQRLWHLLRLIGTYFLLYEASGFLSGRGAIWSCVNGGAACSPQAIANAVRMMGGTPGYYLSDVISLLLIGGAFVAVAQRLGHAGTVALLTLGAAVLLFGDPRVCGLFLNPLAIGCLLWASVWWAFARKPLSEWSAQEGHRRFGPIWMLAVLLTWGLLNYLLARDVYWDSALKALAFGLLLLLVLSFDFVLEPRSRVMRLLSDWGQRYSLGFLLLHQLWYDLTASRIASLLGSAGAPSITIYVAVGALVTGGTAITVMMLERYLPAVVSLHPRPIIRTAEAS